ncbi:MAG TPA: MarR family transcriptional regulator [Bacteroidia bacterium]|nr:MarR family transcriptional regulator [Bacteroidia bacterium]
MTNPPPRKPLSQRQREVRDFLVVFLIENHRQPTTREIADSFGFNQTAAQFHLRSLEKKGWITIDDHGRRRLVGIVLSALYA